jgi:ABC-type uncharacterized transport system substrate-binding protein
LGLLRELLPTAVRIGLLVNPTKANVEGVAKDVTAAGPAIGVQTDVIAATRSSIQAETAPTAEEGEVQQ